MAKILNQEVQGLPAARPSGSGRLAARTGCREVVEVPSLGCTLDMSIPGSSGDKQKHRARGASVWFFISRFDVDRDVLHHMERLEDRDLCTAL